MLRDQSGQGAIVTSRDGGPTAPRVAVARRGSRPQVWSVAGGKGGVGRSFLVANLGCIFARDTGPVALVDLDFGGGNLHTYLGQHVGIAERSPSASGRTARLGAIAREGEVPGLRLIPGHCQGERPPNLRERGLLWRDLRRLEVPTVLLDLESGASRGTLDFFVAADRPILVVLPEPASVEGAHRFIRQAYLYRLENLARARGIDRYTCRRQVEAGESWKPAELLLRLERLSSGLGDALQRELELFRLYLIINQVRHVSDIGVGLALKSALHSYFGISVRFVGSVRHDPEAWLSVRRRRLRVREATADDFGSDLEQVVRNLLEDRELEPSDAGSAALSEG